ncbi:MAG TPA: hypothetical protein DDZ44_00400 [Syntrophomonas wolfei]|jgi:hypothetical protein|uniref:DUF3277 domain-containing protein n=1 Tax=Syntrophomonas wolfei TaxID=863 RepID=A0A354YT67_9FIRM|nr:hypothetical protein [Syntrophomonas wolfei]HBQ85285.1 hypothetical protein [Syntrophomonas sp.]
MRTYDPKDVNVIVGGVALTGFAEDTFVQAERMEDSFTEYVGAKGEVAMAESNNKTGEITVTLEATSPSVEYLNGLANKKGQNAIFPVSVVDLNDDSRVVISGAEARVRKPASHEYGKEIGEREFVIFVSEMEYR